MMGLRTMLFTPGNNLRMLYKAGTLGADAIIIDLEDAVPMADKETARFFTRDILPALSKQPSRVWVRVNALTTGLTGDDIEAVIQAGVSGIMLPKTEGAADIQQASTLLSAAEKQRKLPAASVQLIPLLETARGVAAAREIAAADARVVAVAFGGVDFSRDMRVTLTPEGRELAFARAQIALMAHAGGVQAIDTPWIDVHDRDGLLRHAHDARQYGFHGKLLIHPNQVAPVNTAFSPAPAEIAYARKITAAFEAEQARGAGAISVDGKMIDAANYQQARDLLAYADAIGA